MSPQRLYANIYPSRPHNEAPHHYPPGPHIRRRHQRVVRCPPLLTFRVRKALKGFVCISRTLYCGGSCTNGTLVVSGVDDYTGAPCTDLSRPYDHCYFESEEPWYRAIVYGEADCRVGSETPYATVKDGECASDGPYLSYHVVVNL